MRRVGRIVVRLLKGTAVTLAAVELASFLAITASNWIIYGSPYEGCRARYDPYALFLPAEGRRPTAFCRRSDDPSQNCAIWMFGGSTMRGCTDDDAKTLPSIVARTLNAGPTNGRAYSAVNFGVDSFNSLLETKYLQKALIEEPGDPDLVVFYDGANDSTYLSELRTPYAHHGYRRVRGLIESYRNRKLGILKPLNAAVYASFTKEALDKLTSVTDRIAPDSRLLADYLDLTEKRYDHVARVAAAYGAEFVLFWQPLLWVETGSVEARVKEEEWGYTLPADRFPAFRSNVLLVNQSVAERLADKPYFVDFRNALCGRTQTVYCADGVHLRDAGRELVGLAMADVIRDRLRQRASAIPAVPDRPRATEERPPGAPR